MADPSDIPEEIDGVDSFYKRTLEEVSLTDDTYDERTLKFIHDYVEFEGTTDLALDAFLHAHIIKAIRRRKEAKHG